MNVLALFAIVGALAALIACIPLATRTIRPADTGGSALELQQPAYGTVCADAKVAWLDNYRRARGQWLRKKGRTLLANREYEPHLHAGGRVLDLRRQA